MNQHQFPPCRLAILFIRRNVPPRKLDVDAKASFCAASVCALKDPMSSSRQYWGRNSEEYIGYTPFPSAGCCYPALHCLCRW